MSTEGIAINTLKNGNRAKTGCVAVDAETLTYYGLTSEETLIIEQGNTRYFIDQSETDPTMGKYLIEVDGRLSLNHIQRLPGKLVIDFNSECLELAESDIKVIGRVAMSMGKA